MGNSKIEGLVNKGLQLDVGGDSMVGERLIIQMKQRRWIEHLGYYVICGACDEVWVNLAQKSFELGVGLWKSYYVIGVYEI